MAKILEGTVVSTKMKDTVVVEVVSVKRHKLYKKIVRSFKKYMADTDDKKVELGDFVQIIETRPISKNKHFKILKIKEVNK